MKRSYLKDFEIKVISKGAFIDEGVYPNTKYLVDVTTIRLNHVALNAWHSSVVMNCRECYDTDKEWEQYKAKCKSRRCECEKLITKSLGIDTNQGSVSVTQSLSEIFTVVHIREVKLNETH